MNVIATRVDGDMRLTIVTDMYPESPRDWDNLGTIVTWHSKYNLGDTQPSTTPQEWLDDVKETYGNKIILIPVYLYDHSGITMSTTPFSDYFDSGQVGWIYVTHEDVENEFGVIDDDTIEHAKFILEAEVEAYDKYLQGDVYSFRLEKRTVCDKCGHEKWDVIDSISSVYGNLSKLDGAHFLPHDAAGLFKDMQENGDV